MALSPFDGKIYLTNHGAKGGVWFGIVKKGGNYGGKILGWGTYVMHFQNNKNSKIWQPLSS